MPNEWEWHSSAPACIYCYYIILKYLFFPQCNTIKLNCNEMNLLPLHLRFQPKVMEILFCHNSQKSISSFEQHFSSSFSYDTFSSFSSIRLALFLVKTFLFVEHFIVFFLFSISYRCSFFFYLFHILTFL